MKAEDILASAKLLAVRMFPYFRPAIGKLVPVPMPGLNTFGVTKRFVMYYDPDIILKWMEQKTGAVISHEVCHPLRNHFGRAEAMGVVGDPDWNLAGDMEINDDLRPQCGKHLTGAVYPSTMGLVAGLLAEEYYWQIKAQKEPPLPPQPQPKGGDGDDSESDQDGDSDSDGSQGDGDSPEDNGVDDSTSGESDKSTDDATSPSESSSDSDGDDADQGDQNGSGSGSDSEGDADSDGDGAEGGGGSASESDGGEGIGAGSCGGCAGNPKSFEDELDEKYGRSDRDVEQTRKAVAELVKKAASQSKGDVPDGLVRWADAVLAPPQVPWTQEIRYALRTAIRYQAGAVDATYSRVSRRQAGVGYGPGRPVVTAYRAPIPKVACVVDTSGSVGSDDLVSGVSEIGGICKAVSCEVQFIACDSKDHGITKVRKAEDVKPLLLGGGGTDMTPAFKALSDLPPRDRPDIIVCITDGEFFGDYPPEPEYAKVIWVMVRPTQTPPYGKTIHINKPKEVA